MNSRGRGSNNNINHPRNNSNKRFISNPSNQSGNNNNINLNPRTLNFNQLSHISNLNNQNINPKNKGISKLNFQKNKKEKELAKKKELEIQKKKKEDELEEQIRDHLKCYICLSKVTKPKMCKYCKRICCEKCINHWLENHNFCGICKRQVSNSDMILIPFLDDMSEFFINNIDNRSKKEELFNHKEEDKKFNNNLINKDNNIKFNNNLNTIISESNENYQELDKEEENNLCPEHGDKINYYCIQCDKYFCGQCLIYFGKEAHKHDNHFIVNTEKVNDLGVAEAINEYKKLPKTKSILEDLIGKCNLKLREKETQKYLITRYMKEIKDSYLNKIGTDSNNLKNTLNIVKNAKNNFQNNSSMIQKELTSLLRQDNYNPIQTQEILEKIENMNSIDPSLEREVKSNFKKNSKLFIETYQTDLLEININQPHGRQYNNNEILSNSSLNIFQHYPSTLCFKFNQNKIIISIIAFSEKYADIYSYIIFRNQKYGLEFLDLSQRNKENITVQNQEALKQTLSIEIPYEQFLYLYNEENKISLKVFITKIFYK